MMMTFQQVKALHSRVPSRTSMANRATTALLVLEKQQQGRHNNNNSDASTAETDEEETEDDLFPSNNNNNNTIGEDDDADDDDDDDGDDDARAYESEEETQIAQAMARAAFTKSASTSMLNILLRAAIQEEQQAVKMNKRTRNHQEVSTTKAMTTSTSSIAQQQQPEAISSSGRSFKKARHHQGESRTTGTTSPIRLWASAPSLKSLSKEQQQQQQPTTLPATTSTKPSDKLQTILSQAGYTYKTYPYTSLMTSGFFCKLSPEQINLYDTNLVRAVRDQDIGALKERLAAVTSNSSSLFAGNKFGETILHASCRRSALPIVQFLLHQADHPVRVCCDYGRTVLHDAAWTCSPDFDVITELLETCPDLLYVCDRRGFTALDYIPKEQYVTWCEYLVSRGAHRLLPAILH